MAFVGPSTTTECVASGHCEGLFYRGVGELLSVGNGSVYDAEMLGRWWQSSQLSSPFVEQSFIGSPASLPFFTLYGLGEASQQGPALAFCSALLFGLSALWAGGALFALVCLLGAWTATATVLGLPSLFMATGAMLLWIGLARDRSWTAALGLTFLAFRVEWALWIVLGLIWKRKFKPLLVAAFLTTLLWVGASLFWGMGISEAWLASLQNPAGSIEPGIGLVGLLPGGAQWIGVWWFFYGMAGLFALRSWHQDEAHKAMALSLAIALLFSPQITMGDMALLAPLFVAFFPRPERPALVAGLGGYILLGVGAPALMALMGLFLVYSSAQIVPSTFASEVS